MIAGKPLACISVVILISLCFGVGKTVGEEQHQNPFHTYVLDTGSGTSGAAFSPDGRLVAVLSRKESSAGQGTEAIEKIQIWDFRTQKVILEKVLASQWLRPPDAAHERETFLYSYSPSGSTVVLYRNGHVVLLDSNSLEEVRTIDLHTEAWPKLPPNSSSHVFVKKVCMDRREDRIAVLLQWGRGGGGELRVYDLRSGKIVRKWDYHDLRTGNDRTADFGGMDIAPDGREVAVSTIPFVFGEGDLRASDQNVFVLDIDSGERIAAMNTGYPAGDVSFAATDPLILLTVSADNFDRGRSKTDAIKVWNPLTGKLLRELDNPPGGVHFEIQTSTDGRTALGYTGLEKFEGRWWLLQEESGTVAYDQFCLWDLATENIVACSPEIPPSGSRSIFQLSPKGDVVLLYPSSVFAGPLTFYELQSIH